MNLFKAMTVAALSLTISLSAFAGLKQTMKEIGGLFKQIGTTVSDTTQNATNAERAGKMADLFAQALNEAPESVADLSAEAAIEAMKEYTALITKEINNSQALKAAFLNNDNATAAAILKDMNAGKREGHDKFE